MPMKLQRHDLACVQPDLNNVPKSGIQAVEAAVLSAACSEFEFDFLAAQQHLQALELRIRMPHRLLKDKAIFCRHGMSCQ